MLRRRVSGTIQCHVPPMAFGGPPSPTPEHPILARDRVRCVGDPVAFVVAETLLQAQDAAELIEVDYETLPAVGSTRDAVKDGAPLVWDDNKGNLWFEMDRGDASATNAAFATATHVVRANLHQTGFLRMLWNTRRACRIQHGKTRVDMLYVEPRYPPASPNI